MDNLNTHNAGSFYEKFPPDKARTLWERFEFIRIDNIEAVRREVAAWQSPSWAKR